jgi:hypothetical protein
MSKSDNQSVNAVVVQSTETAILPITDFVMTDDEVVQLAKQHGDIRNTMHFLVEGMSRVTSLFRVLLYWLSKELVDDGTGNIDKQLSMTAIDAAEYLCDVAGCHFNPYTRNGIRLVESPDDEGRIAVSQRSKHLGTVVSYIRSRAKAGCTLDQIINCSTINDLRQLTPPTAEDKPKADDELVSDYLRTAVLRETRKLANENTQFIKKLRDTLKQFNVDIADVQVVTTKKVVAKK